MAMRLPEGIAVNEELTFGELKFSALKREDRILDDDGNLTTEVKSRVYDLKSRAQGMIIDVKLPVEAGVKDYPYDARVKLVNPVLIAIAAPTFGNNASAEWYLSADDIILVEDAAKTGSGQTGISSTGASASGNADKTSGASGTDGTRDAKDRK